MSGSPASAEGKMTSIDIAGEASFSTLNIRRCGHMAPKVEIGAFRFSSGPGRRSRSRRPAQRAGLAESGAEQRPGPGATEGTRAGTPQPAGVGGSRRGGHRGCRGGSRCACERRRRSLSPRRACDLWADHVGAHHFWTDNARPANQDPSGDSRPGDRGSCEFRSTAEHDALGSAFDESPCANQWRIATATADRATEWADHR
jgi:hypothetical protein